MKFKLVGSNRQTGARVTMEVEAASRASAEKQADQQGIDVLHAERIAEQTDSQQQEPQSPRVSHRGEFPEESHALRWVVLAVLLLGAVVAVVAYWDKIRGF